MKEAVRRSKEDGKPIKEALWSRVVGASTSGPFEYVGEIFTPPTTIMDTSAEPDATIDGCPTNDKEVQSAVHDKST